MLTDDRGQVVTIRDGVALAPTRGIVAHDGETVIHDPGIGDGLVPLIGDTNGEWGAFDPPPAPFPDGTIASGWVVSDIVVRSPFGKLLGVELDGNIVPEAFSLERWESAAPTLYVLEYLPPEAPTHYRVRLLDPGTGELSWPGSLRDYGLTVETEMAGISRDEVIASEEALLFTLYRGHHFDEGTDYAFIHVLSMWGGVWCLEVPVEMELAFRPGAVAVSPDESTLYAVSSNGTVAEYRIDDVLDPARQPVARRVVAHTSASNASPNAVVTDEHVVVTHGRDVIWLERDGLIAVGAATAPEEVDAVTAAGHGTVVVAWSGQLGIARMGESVAAAVTLPAGAGRVTNIVRG